MGHGTTGGSSPHREISKHHQAGRQAGIFIPTAAQNHPFIIIADSADMFILSLHIRHADAHMCALHRLGRVFNFTVRNVHGCLLH